MAIEVGYFFKQICNTTYGSSIGYIFKNVLYMSIVLSIIILIIICSIYPCKKGTPISTTFKLVFYIFTVNLVLLSAHYGILECQFEEKYSNEINKDLLGAVKGGSLNSLLGAGDKVKITPKINDSVMHNEHIEDHNARSSYLSDMPKSEDADKIKVKSETVEDMLRELNV